MSPIQLSQRAQNTPPSPIRRLAHLAGAAKAKGRRVFHLNIGQPDIKSPREFLDGIGLFKDEVVAYEASEGNPRLRAEWAGFMRKSLGLNISPDQFLITTGASEALIFVFMTCCDPGDEILIFDPTYANYIGFAAISGVKLVSILTNLEDGFALPAPEVIESRISPKTHGILLCSPNNPTGTVYSRSELRMLLDICNRHNIFLIVDETYREIVYDGLEPLSILHLEDGNDRVVVVYSLSKRFSLCGARIGCLITSNQELRAKALNQAQARLSVSSVDQFAAAHMLATIGPEYLSEIRREYEKRRDAMFEALQQLPDVLAHRPLGAFYTVARLPIDDADQFASFLLSEFSFRNSTVFVAPASGFYMSNGRGQNKVRLASVLEVENLVQAVEVLGHGLLTYRAVR